MNMHNYLLSILILRNMLFENRTAADEIRNVVCHDIRVLVLAVREPDFYNTEIFLRRYGNTGHIGNKTFIITYSVTNQDIA